MNFLKALFSKLLKTPDPRLSLAATVSKSTSTNWYINEAGLDLIKHFESCLKPTGRGTFAAYADPAHGWKVPTIGWGTIAYPDGIKVKQGDEITQEQADALLAWEVNEKAEGVRELVTVPLTQDQFSALVSFSYNVGLGNLKRSTLLKKLNAGEYNGAAMEFPKWNQAAGQVLAGLTRRRFSEQRLFLSRHPAIIR